MPSPEKPDSAGEGAEVKAAPMGRFRDLAKRLVAVSPADMKEAERQYQFERDSVAEPPKAKSPSR